MTHIAHIPTPFEVPFAQIDAEGNTRSIARAQAVLAAVTPLAAMELFEHLHAVRNKVRKDAGLPELPTPDSALLILAFLRREAEQPAEGLRGLLEHFDAAAKVIQVARLDGATENGKLKVADPSETWQPTKEDLAAALRDREE